MAWQARPLAGTEGASFPFWSPDSRSIAFFAGGKLKKVDTMGGAPEVLCDAAGGRGGAWSPDGDDRLRRSAEKSTVASRRQAAAPSDPRRRSIASRAPLATPGRSSCPTAGTFSSIRLVSSPNIRASTWRRWTPLKQRASSPAQAPVSTRPATSCSCATGCLFAQAFDDRALQTRGEAVRIADRVGYFSAAFGYIGRHRVTGRCARLRAERGDDHQPPMARSRRGDDRVGDRAGGVSFAAALFRSEARRGRRSGSPKPDRTTSG